MKALLLSFFALSSLYLFSQNNTGASYNYQQEFNFAYSQFPNVPKGVLEAVSYTTTRINHLQNTTESCVGIPKTYGVMGLTLDGKNYFKNNLEYIAKKSGITVNDILESPQQNILAFASAYHQEQLLLSPFKYKSQNIAHVLSKLSELPDNNLQQNYALNAHLYSVLSFLNNPKMQRKYHFPDYHLDLKQVFGKENLKVLSSKKIMISDVVIEGEEGMIYKNNTPNNKSADYPPAIQDLTPCNFSSRNGTPITAVTIHTMQGSYAGSISWFKDCNANASAHYMLRSSDGQVTQMVLESDKAWHVGSENPYTIGLEHEGFVSDSTWYTAAMYNSSADLVKDITTSGYGISPLRTAYFPWASTTNYNTSTIPGNCVKIKGHHHFPNQSHTDPGEFWDWKYYDNIINSASTVNTLTTYSGTVTDTGGVSGNYGNDERQLILIQPPNAINITLNTIQFNLENTWDYLYLYDGNSVFSPIIGIYSGTTIPSSITSSTGSLMLELRSDCATTTGGFEFNFTSTIPDTISPTTSISASPTPFATTNFISTFTDADNNGGSGIMHQFYQVSDFNAIEWRANNTNGFFNDDYNNTIHSDWIDSSGVWSIVNGKLQQSSETNTNTNIFASLNQNNSNKFLYHYKATISGSGTNKRAGFHYMCDDASQTNRGNSYFVWFRQDQNALQFYEVTNNSFTLAKNIAYTFNANQEYDYKIVYDKTSGITEVYIDNVFIDSWQDLTPITVGNHISFRSGNCIYELDDLRVYHTRTNSENILIGTAANNDIRYENNPNTSGKIQSITIDSANNISTIAAELVDVEFIGTSIIEDNRSLIQISPNPFKDVITINTNTNEILLFTLFDINGKLILTQTLNKQQTQLNISKRLLSSGIYVVKIIGETINETHQIIKE